jgi:hypothetical protein
MVLNPRIWGTVKYNPNTTAMLRIPVVIPLSAISKPATMKYTQLYSCLLGLLTTARAIATIIRRREAKIISVDYSRPFTGLSQFFHPGSLPAYHAMIQNG